MIHYVRKYVNQHFGSIIKMKIKANPNATNSEMDAKTILKSELTSVQKNELAQQFAEIVVDGMDTKSLVAFAMDKITEYYDTCSIRELKEEVDNYDEGLYDELVDNVINAEVN